MSELFLIAEIDGAMIAIESDMVESVVRVQDFIPVPRIDPLVAGIFALRSRVLTLIDTQFAVTERPRPVPANALAIIAQIGGFHFGLLVDAVKDVVTVQPEQYVTSIKAGSNWMPYSKGLVDIDGQIVVIICPAKIVEGKQDMAA
jgi:purine-binding chemotaxis protein CheW